MHWILIFWISVGYGVTTDHIYFESEAACKSAFKTMGAIDGRNDGNLYGVCVNDQTIKEEGK